MFIPSLPYRSRIVCWNNGNDNKVLFLLVLLSSLSHCPTWNVKGTRKGFLFPFSFLSLLNKSKTCFKGMRVLGETTRRRATRLSGPGQARWGESLGLSRPFLEETFFFLFINVTDYIFRKLCLYLLWSSWSSTFA